MRVNQAGQEVFDNYVSVLYGELNENDLREIVGLMLEKMKLEVWRTNATKYGHVELYLKDVD